MTETENQPESKYTLLTNLSFIQSDQVPDLRLWCHAILLTHDPDPKSGMLGPTFTMRGFGVDPSWEVFTWFLTPEHFPFKVTAAHDDSAVILHDGDEPPTPLFSGSLLKFANDTKFFLQAEDAKQPLDVFRHEEIRFIWNALSTKAAHYWQAPNIPTLNYVPAAFLKQRL